MRRIPILAGLLLIATTAPAAAASGKFVERFADWSAYVGESAANKVCFAISQPKEIKPKNVKRGPIYFYISHWPGDKVQGEISIKIGYPLKVNTPTEVSIGNDKFKLFTKDEGAFVDSSETEKRMITAMTGGSEMIVQGRSKRGTLTTDRYSLNGISAALKRIAKDCP